MVEPTTEEKVERKVYPFQFSLTLGGVKRQKMVFLAFMPTDAQLAQMKLAFAKDMKEKALKVLYAELPQKRTANSKRKQLSKIALWESIKIEAALTPPEESLETLPHATEEK